MGAKPQRLPPASTWRPLLLGTLLGCALTLYGLRRAPQGTCGCHAPAYTQAAQRHDFDNLLAAAGSVSGVACENASATPQHQSPPPLPLPWQPLLTPVQLKRGLAFYGSGERMEAVAARLLAGQPITAVTLGASITRGHGASAPDKRFPMHFFHFLNSSFPNSGHTFVNKGIGATNSGIFAVCLDQLVPRDTDLAVVEFSFNEPPEVPLTDPTRRGFEQLLRKLARLPRAPAVIVLHHYAWYFAAADGLEAGQYYRAPEQHLSTLAQYYDMPSPSLRNALYREMQADVPPFKVSSVVNPNQTSLAGAKLPWAEPGTEGQYLFADGIHPSDVGHQALAELLAGVVRLAVQNVAAAQPVVAAGSKESGGNGRRGEGGGEASLDSDGSGGGLLAELPPPMIPGNVDSPTSLCAMQESFKSMAKDMHGFAWRAERPDMPTFVEQKWGYRAEKQGSWIELEVSSEETLRQPGEQPATVHVGYLRSYERMGLARAECQAGCTCEPQLLDGLWDQRVSLQQMHTFQVSQHPRCRIRITTVQRSADMPGGARPPGAGNKFQLTSVMVAHMPVVLASYALQAHDLEVAVGTASTP